LIELFRNVPGIEAFSGRPLTSRRYLVVFAATDFLDDGAKRLVQPWFTGPERWPIEPEGQASSKGPQATIPEATVEAV
jgi:hypothetical protein